MNYYKVIDENGMIIYCSQDTLLDTIDNCETALCVIVISEADYYDLYKDAFDEQH